MTLTRLPLLAACTLMLWGQYAAAHFLGLTDTSLEVAAPGVRVLQTLPTAELAELGVASGGGDDGYLRTVAAGWQLTSGDVPCTLASASQRPLEALQAIQFDLRFSCADVASTLTVEYALAAAFEATHVNLARVYLGKRQLPFRFTRDRAVLRIPVATILARSRAALPDTFRDDDPNAALASAPPTPTPDAPSGGTPDADEAPGGTGDSTGTPTSHKASPPGGLWLTNAMIYLPSGVEHILAGPDHVAFVLALVLIPLGVRRLMLAISLFTLAHSVTLGLAYFGVLSLPPSLTEPLIALSVTAVGIENLLAHRHSRVLRLRELTVFLFGLVHGVGLSYQLGELPAQSAGDGAIRLLMFNVGVELGQLAILLFPGLLISWAVRQPRGWIVTRAGSALLIVLGLAWFLNRLPSP